MWCARVIGLVSLAAAAVVGCGSSHLGGNGDAGAGGAGGSPEIADYLWGNVKVHVAPTTELPGGLFLMQVTDPAGRNDTWSFADAVRWNPNNGAYSGPATPVPAPAFTKSICSAARTSSGPKRPR